MAVLVSTFNRYKTEKVLDVDSTSTSSDSAILHSHLYIAVILCDILLQFHHSHVVMYIHNCSAHMPNGAYYRTFGMVLSMYKMDVVFNKDHKLSILQIAVKNIIHSQYQGKQRHCNFFHGLYSIILEVDSIIFVLCTGSYSNIFYFLTWVQS